MAWPEDNKALPSLQSPTGATKKKKEIAKDKASHSPFNKTIQKKKTK